MNETYTRAVCDIIPQKIETHRPRLNEIGNIIDYTGEFITPSSDLTTMKLHVKSSISNIKSIYMCIDVRYSPLNNRMYKSEYINIHISMILLELIDKYNLRGNVNNGYMYVQVTKGCMDFHNQ